jgi:hypothetical protein
LDDRSGIAFDGAKAAGSAANEHAIRAEHRAIGVNANSSASRTAWCSRRMLSYMEPTILIKGWRGFAALGT